MKCQTCQTQNVADARFCAQCGHALVTTPPAPKAAPADFSSMYTLDSSQESAPAATPDQLQPGTVFADRYVISVRLGEGGSAQVYRAQDRATGKDVALKVFRSRFAGQPGAAARIVNAGAAARDIRHPNVVAIYDVGQVQGSPYLAMELLDGVSLRSWNNRRLGSGADLQIGFVVNIIRAILDALMSIHIQKLVTDLKMSSVMLLSDPEQPSVKLKVVDLGFLAAALPDTNSTGNLAINTMAPEALTAPESLKPSADIYSLSVMFYELLTGVLPGSHWEPPSVGRDDVPAGIDDLIRRGLSNNPRQRPQGPAEFREQLDKALGDDPKPVPAPPPRPVPPPKPAPDEETTLWKIPKFLVPVAKWLNMPFAQVMLILQQMLNWFQVLSMSTAFGRKKRAGDGGADPVIEPVVRKKKMGLGLRIVLGLAGIAAIISGLAQMGVLNFDDFGADPVGDAARRVAENDANDPKPKPDTPDRDPEPVPVPPPPPEPPRNQFAELNGRWMDDFGDTWRMTFNPDGSFKGEATGGQFAGLGMLGNFDGRTFNFAVGSGNQTLGAASGVFDGQCHINYQTLDPAGSGLLINAQLHMKHQAGADCP